MKNSMVSIVVPVYRVENYLHQCIDSLLAQTYRNIQVILVDDGSPDSCGKICDEYAAKDSRVLALHKKNGGVSSARNHGLEYITGDYVTFCDSDDAYQPDWIERLVRAMEDAQADTALGCFAKVFSDGVIRAEDPHETGVWDTADVNRRLEYSFDKLMSPKHGWEITVRLFRTDIIIRHRIRFCEHCGNYAEDLGFTLTYALYANRVASIDYAGYLYNIRQDSMMQTSAGEPKLESVHQVAVFVEPVLREVFAPDLAEKVMIWVYLQMVGGEFIAKLWSSGTEPEAFRKSAISRVKDWPGMEQRLTVCLKNGNWWNPGYSAGYNLELMCHMRFLLSGSWMKLRIQCKLIRMFRPVIDMAGRCRKKNFR